MPDLRTEGLRPAQVDAISGIERSLVEQRHDRSLVQMATGAGKTYTAVIECYRLLRHAGFRRALFLVDRNNLGDRTLREFQNYATPDDGRGARTISDADFQAVTPDAATTTRFVLVDAIGVTEHDYVDAARLERARAVPLKRLLEQQLTPTESAELDAVAGQPLKEVVRRLVAAVDPDEQAVAVAAAPDDDRAEAIQRLLDEAVQPLAANPGLRARILELRVSHGQVIDEVSVDVLLDARASWTPIGPARSSRPGAPTSTSTATRSPH